MSWPSRIGGTACTGLSATWCPNHGDCTCFEDEITGRSFTATGCPLHGPASLHAEPGAFRVEP